MASKQSKSKSSTKSSDQHRKQKKVEKNPADNLPTATTPKVNEKEQQGNFLHDIFLPHLALIVAPMISSVNTTLSRATFTVYDKSKGQEPLHPMTFSVCRTIIAFLIYYIIKRNGWFGSSSSAPATKPEVEDVDDNDEEEKEREEKERELRRRRLSHLHLHHHRTRSDISIPDTTETNKNTDEKMDGMNDEIRITVVGTNQNDDGHGENNLDNLLPSPPRKMLVTNSSHHHHHHHHHHHENISARRVVGFVPSTSSYPESMDEDEDRRYDAEFNSISRLPAMTPTVTAAASIITNTKYPGVARNQERIGDKDPLHSGANFIDWLQLILLGFVGIAVNFMCFFHGLEFTSGLVAAGMMTLTPSICFFIGCVTGIETFSLLKAFSTVFVWVGNVFMSEIWLLFSSSTSDSLTLNNNFSSNSTFFLNDSSSASSSSSAIETTQQGPKYRVALGVLLLFGNTLAFGSYIVFSKPLLKKFNFVDFMLVVMSAGLVGLLFFSLFPRQHLVMDQLFGGNLSWVAWVGIIYAGIIQSALNYFITAYGIARVKSPLFYALANNSQPVFVVLESISFLGETMHTNQKIGAAVIVVGVAFSIYVSVSDKLNDDEMKKIKKEQRQIEREKRRQARVAELEAEIAEYEAQQREFENARSEIK